MVRQEPPPTCTQGSTIANKMTCRRQNRPPALSGEERTTLRREKGQNRYQFIGIPVLPQLQHTNRRESNKAGGVSAQESCTPGPGDPLWGQESTLQWALVIKEGHLGQWEHSGRLTFLSLVEASHNLSVLLRPNRAGSLKGSTWRCARGTGVEGSSLEGKALSLTDGLHFLSLLQPNWSGARSAQLQKLHLPHWQLGPMAGFPEHLPCPIQVQDQTASWVNSTNI